MHELAVTKSILRLALDHAAAHGGGRVLAIRLAVGELRNLEQDWLQRYFEQIARGTAAEGARIAVRKIPAAFRCNGCGQQFTADLRSAEKITCGRCRGSEYDLVAGRELTVEQLEVR